MALKTDLRAMLRKFGVVTVMDVKAYQAERYQQDDASENHKYSKGEWDCKSTFCASGLTTLAFHFDAGDADAENESITYIPKNTSGTVASADYRLESGTATITGVAYTEAAGLNPAKITVTRSDTTQAADIVLAYKVADGQKKQPLFELDTLKIANINSEGPTKSITGGQNADTLLKYGKTFTIEMQDALGRYDVLESIFGVNFSANHQFASVTDRFPAELTIVGSTFVIDQKTGAKQPIKIVLPLFLGDGILNLTQDAEGDASVFDLNGSLLRFNGIDGGAADSDIENCGEDRFNDNVAHTWDGDIYKAGKDNEFYFLCTNEGYDKLETLDYSDAIKDLA